ncbi:MAG: HD domain-containing protein [Chloroflexi bacterium]|nr:HD domain-containing protein [Chloroflexota bacterium]
MADQLEADAVCILLFNPHMLTLEFAAGSGFHTGAIQNSRLHLGEGIAGYAALKRELIVIPDIREEKEFVRADLLAGENFTGYWGVPLVAKGEVKGLLEVFHRNHRDEDPAWMDFLKTLAGQSAIAIDNAQLFEDLKRSHTELVLAYDDTIEGWSRAMDLRDRETEGHTRRVTEMTLNLARLADISTERLIHVKRGALLHDIGKLGVPDSILHKPGALTDDEWKIMHRHPQLAYDMLSPIAYLKPALDIPYCHHEKWDGTGYPRGLKGEEIPLEARLFAVADVWDALTSDRPYRAAWSQEKALEYIKEQSGRHFDPQAVELFFGLRECL